MAKGLVEQLEGRTHRGPPVLGSEIQSAREFLRNHDFSPASEYFTRLADIENRVGRRPAGRPATAMKSNYGGEAAGYRMQLQCIYDHLILSTCYDGTFRSRRGRVKVSHRFNQAGRIDFVELKFLNSLHPALNGETRKLLLVKGYDALRRDWHTAEAYVLPTLPQELVFLYEDVFRSERHDLFAWLINIGHGLVDDMLKDLRSARTRTNGHTQACAGTNGHGRSASASLACQIAAVESAPQGASPSPASNPQSPQLPQLPLSAVVDDPLAMDILARCAVLESRIETIDPRHVLVRYTSGESTLTAP